MNWLVKLLSEHLEFTVKGLKSWEHQGHHGYQGNLLYRGKKVAWFHNDGWGGGTDIDYADKKGEKIITDYCKKIGKISCDVGGEEPFIYDFDIDTLVSAVCDRTDTLRSLKRNCKNKTIVVTPDSKEGMWTQFKVAFTPEVKHEIIKRYPQYKDATFANEII